MAAQDYYNRDAAKELMDRLAAGPLVAQGPTGSLLVDEAGTADVPAVFWNIAEPQALTRMHALYQMAGADVLITNTFQASAPCLKRDSILQDYRSVNRAGADCALTCSRITGVPAKLVLGSVGPCGIAWEDADKDEGEEGAKADKEAESAVHKLAREAYRNQATILLESGVAGVLLETFCSLHDLEPAVTGAVEAAHGMPVLASFAIDDACHLLGDGAAIEQACEAARDLGAQAIGVNCCSAYAATQAVPRMVRAVDLPVMVRPNAGAPTMDQDGCPHWDEDVEGVARASVQWVTDGARLVGTCCGFTPIATCAISGALHG